jgi:hypothetical protein
VKREDWRVLLAIVEVVIVATAALYLFGSYQRQHGGNAVLVKHAYSRWLYAVWSARTTCSGIVRGYAALGVTVPDRSDVCRCLPLQVGR